MKQKKQSLFDAVGGLVVMERVHKVFYDKVYAHPWLGKFFEGHDQAAIELRQTQFMAEKMGAKREYPGRELPLVHRRMYITEELLTVRQALLRESLPRIKKSQESNTHIFVAASCTIAKR